LAATQTILPGEINRLIEKGAGVRKKEKELKYMKERGHHLRQRGRKKNLIRP